MILDTIKYILSGKIIAEDTVEEIDYETSFEDLGFNEFDMSDLCMGIESEFGIELTDEQIEKIHTIGDLTAAIEEML